MEMRPGKGHHAETSRFPEMESKAYCSSNPSWFAPCSLVHMARVLDQQGLSFQDSSFQVGGWAAEDGKKESRDVLGSW